MSEKERMAAARKLATAHGVKVLGWNDKRGKEYISFDGSGDRLQALKPEMAKEGWHIWPQGPGEEGRVMEFSLYPPPDKPDPSSMSITEDEDPLQLPQVNSEYRYRGPTSNFFSQWMALSVILVGLVWLKRNMTAVDVQLNIVLSICAVGLTGLLLLWMGWVEISGNAETLTIRKHFLGKPQEVAFRDIKRAKIHVEKNRGRTRRFLGIGLKSGKALDLFLPDRKQKELLVFTRRRAGIVVASDAADTPRSRN